MVYRAMWPPLLILRYACRKNVWIRALNRLYAQSKEDVIVAAGSIALADSTVANVAKYFISNSTWTAVGDANNLPGPVTAVAVNDLNSSSIFAAGRSSDNSSAFLYFWDGQSWSSVGECRVGMWCCRR